MAIIFNYEKKQNLYLYVFFISNYCHPIKYMLYIYKKFNQKHFINIVSKTKHNYHKHVIDHYENPRNVGSFPKNTPNIATGIVGAPACGDVMKIQLQIQNDIIIDAKFKTFGCGSAIASSSYVTEIVKGKTVQDALSVKNQQIAQHLKLPPVKLHCSMLAEDAITNAIQNYQSLSENKK